MTGPENGVIAEWRYTAKKFAANPPNVGLRTLGPRPSQQAVTWAAPNPLPYSHPTPLKEGSSPPPAQQPPLYVRPPLAGDPVQLDSTGTNPVPHARLRTSVTDAVSFRASNSMAYSMNPSMSKGVNTPVTPSPRFVHNYQVQMPPVASFAYGPSAKGSNSTAPEKSVFGIGGGQPNYIAQTGMDKSTRHLA